MVARDLTTIAAHGRDLTDRLSETLVPFEAYFGGAEFSSYDPTDIYDTALGRHAKRAWARKSRAAFFYVAPLMLLDMTAPASRALFASKKTHPICIAQAGLAYLRLSQIRSDVKQQYIGLAQKCFTRLRSCATATRSGVGWGLNIYWETASGAMPPFTPCHTQTAYAFELIMALNRVAPSDELIDYLARIADHTAYDYREFAEPMSRLRVTGYSVIDTRPVLNAQSYRMLILLAAYAIFRRQGYLERAVDALEYLMHWQDERGAWPYSPEERFVDGYHTCFILKNLAEASRILRKLTVPGSGVGDLQIRSGRCIERGYGYFVRHLLDSRSRPIPFSVANKPVHYRYDAYDLAEALNLVSLFGDIPRVERLLQFFYSTMRLASGLVRYRYYAGWSWVSPGISYDRYANSAFFLAAANALYRLSGCHENRF